MNFIVHHLKSSDTNSYLLGPDGPGPAILIDPGAMDNSLLRHIEDNHYTLGAILVTRPREYHVSGIKTLRRIYDAEIIAPFKSIYSIECRFVQDGDEIRQGEFSIRVMGMPKHARDSVVYYINGLLFPGDVLTAGIVDLAATPYGRALLAETIRSELFALPPCTPIFPSFGPPTTVSVEAGTNPDCLISS